MGSCKFVALTLFCIALSLLTCPASSRILQVQKPSTDEEAHAPTSNTSGPQNTNMSNELGKSSLAVQNPGTKNHLETPPPAAQTDLATQGKADLPHSPPPPPPDAGESKRQDKDGGQASVPPPLVQNLVEGNPPPGPSSAGDAKDENGREQAQTNKIEEEVEACDAGSETCDAAEFSACLQVSRNASVGLYFIVLKKGQNPITVDVKTTQNIDVDVKNLPLTNRRSIKVNITHGNPNGGEITLNSGTGQCILHIRQPAFDWQQQVQQFAAYATRLNPMYSAYFFVFTVVLVGVVWACCKFARRSDAGVPYQQLEMGAQAPSSAVADNSTSTVDGWEDGWDDDWDDEEAVARPSDKKTAESVSGNGLSLRSQKNNNKDDWDVDWDD